MKQKPISLANIRDLVNTSLGANMGDDRIRESLIRQNVRIANAGNNRYVITGSALDEMNQCVQDSTRLHDKIITKYFQGSTLDYEKKLLWFRFVLTEFLMQYYDNSSFIPTQIFLQHEMLVYLMLRVSGLCFRMMMNGLIM